MKWLIDIASILGDLLISIGVYLLIVEIFPSVSNLRAVIFTVLISRILVWLLNNLWKSKKKDS